MSAVPSSGVQFEIRSPQEPLAVDLKAIEALVDSTAQRLSTKTITIGLGIDQAKLDAQLNTAVEKIQKREAVIQVRAESAGGGIRASQLAEEAIRESIQARGDEFIPAPQTTSRGGSVVPPKVTSVPLDESFGGAGMEIVKVNEQLEKTNDSLEKAATRAVRFYTAIRIARLAADALNVAAAAIKFGTADNFDQREEARGELRKSTEKLDTAATGGLGEAIAKIAPWSDAISKWAGVMTFAEEAAAKKEQERRDKQAAHVDDMVRRGERFEKVMDAAAKSANEQLSQLGKGEFDRISAQIEQQRKRVEDAIQEAPESRKAKGGALTDTAQAALDAANKLAAAQQEQLDDAIFSQRLGQEAELNALRLRNEGKIADAEREEFKETLRQRQEAADKISPEAGGRQREINAEALTGFDADATERQAERIRSITDRTDDYIESSHEAALKAAGKTYEADVAAYEAAWERKLRALDAAIAKEKDADAQAELRAEKEAAMDARAAEDKERTAAVSRKAEDLDFQSRQIDLRAHGNNIRAEVESIEKRAEEEFKGAEGNPELQAAIKRNAEARLKALDTELNQAGTEARVVVASRTNLLGGGATDPARDTADTLKTLIAGLLRQIAANTSSPQPAVLGP